MRYRIALIDTAAQNSPMPGQEVYATDSLGTATRAVERLQALLRTYDRQLKAPRFFPAVAQSPQAVHQPAQAVTISEGNSATQPGEAPAGTKPRLTATLRTSAARPAAIL